MDGQTNQSAPQTHNRVEYGKDVRKLVEFLTTYEQTEQFGRKYIYMDKLVNYWTFFRRFDHHIASIGQ
jgi:hypothetical protein